MSDKIIIHGSKMSAWGDMYQMGNPVPVINKIEVMGFLSRKEYVKILEMKRPLITIIIEDVMQ